MDNNLAIMIIVVILINAASWSMLVYLASQRR
jgi:hypothetical protein